MPGNWVHYYFAKDMAKDHSFTFKNEKAYYLGALGPDFLYYLPQQSRGQEVFTMFHEEKTREILCYVFDWIEKKELKAYLYGFLTHYALDSGSSFFIYSLQNEGFDKYSVKMALDEAILRRRKLRPSGRSLFYPLINLGKELPKEIAGFYQGAGKEVYNLDLSLEEINLAYRRFVKVLKVSSSSFSFLKVRRYWYDKAPEQLYSKEISEELFKEFLESYEDSRKFFKRLLTDRSPCAERNFHGDLL